jgi:DNA-binding NtrC family response regulator
MFRILIVEDNFDLRAQMKYAAKSEGRQIMEAENAEQGIRLIRENDFDVVVTDLRMETDLAGLDVLKAAKEKDVYTQVIMITEYGTPDVSIETMRLGAFDFIERRPRGIAPLDMLRSKINLAIEFREAKINKMGITVNS